MKSFLCRNEHKMTQGNHTFPVAIKTHCPDCPIHPPCVYMYIEYYWRNVWRNQRGNQNP